MWLKGISTRKMCRCYLCISMTFGWTDYVHDSIQWISSFAVYYSSIGTRVHSLWFGHVPTSCLELSFLKVIFLLSQGAFITQFLSCATFYLGHTENFIHKNNQFDSIYLDIGVHSTTKNISEHTYIGQYIYRNQSQFIHN